MRFTLSLLLIAGLTAGVVGCATYRVPRGDNYVLYMDNVTEEMTHPGYWLKPSDHPDRIIMSEVEIAEYFKTPEKDFDYISQNGKIDTGYIQRIIKVYGAERTLFDANGDTIAPSHWGPAVENMNRHHVTGIVRYALAVAKAEERSLPTAERGYQDSDNALFDDYVMTQILVNEQLLVLHTSSDSLWYLVIGKYAPAGWVHRDNIAFCSSKEEWNKTQTGDFLLVTADKILLPTDDPDGNTSAKITMGTKLQLIAADSAVTDSNHRFGKNVYPVAYPIRLSNGALGYKEVFLPARDGVHVGYLPYTRRNILNQAFRCLGNRYGWGGMFDARDCSSYVQDIYRCFGINIPRNSFSQSKYLGKTIELEGMSPEAKYHILKKEAAPGALLFLNGHVFMYLGEENDKIYAINSASSLLLNDRKTYIQSVVINTLNERRANGKTWLESTNKCKLYETDN